MIGWILIIAMLALPLSTIFFNPEFEADDDYLG